MAVEPHLWWCPLKVLGWEHRFFRADSGLNPGEEITQAAAGLSLVASQHWQSSCCHIWKKRCTGLLCKRHTAFLGPLSLEYAFTQVVCVGNAVSSWPPGIPVAPVSRTGHIQRGDRIGKFRNFQSGKRRRTCNGGRLRSAANAEEAVL